MAAFRGITAEEESATAVFLSLKRLRYPEARRLLHKNHGFKNALAPFLSSALAALSQVPLETFRATLLMVEHSGRKAIQIQWRLPGIPENHYLESSAPLHFSLKEGPTGGENTPIDFREQLAQLAAHVNRANIVDYLEERANLRNRLLYAGSEGYPSISGDMDQGFNEFQARVFRNLRLLLMIDPYRKHKLLVSHALVVFLDLAEAAREGVKFE